jgi:hypothetical protein
VWNLWKTVNDKSVERAAVPASGPVLQPAE